MLKPGVWMFSNLFSLAVRNLDLYVSRNRSHNFDLPLLARHLEDDYTCCSGHRPPLIRKSYPYF